MTPSPNDPAQAALADELLSCPFCGKAPKCNTAYDDDGHSRAICFECPDGCSVSKDASTYKDAVTIWNTRSPALPAAGEVRDDPQFNFAWILNEVLCEIIEAGVTESREIASRAVTHPKIKAAIALPQSKEAGETIQLADHAEIRRKVANQPREIQRAVVTIAAHCTALTDECQTGTVADLAGCISQCCLELANALPASPAPQGEDMTHTLATLLSLLNPLHGDLDKQTYDAKVAMDFDMPSDYGHDVIISAQQERDLTQAVCILENRLAAIPAAPDKE